MDKNYTPQGKDQLPYHSSPSLRQGLLEFKFIHKMERKLCFNQIKMSSLLFTQQKLKFNNQRKSDPSAAVIQNQFKIKRIINILIKLPIMTVLMIMKVKQAFKIVF